MPWTIVALDRIGVNFQNESGFQNSNLEIQNECSGPSRRTAALGCGKSPAMVNSPVTGPKIATSSDLTTSATKL